MKTRKGFSNRRFERRFWVLLPPWAKVPRARRRGMSLWTIRREGVPRLRTVYRYDIAAQAHFTSQAAASVGYLPAAVSLVSIRCSAPSQTAWQMSDTSARVGTGRSVMELSSSVTTSRGLCTWRHTAAMRRWVDRRLPPPAGFPYPRGV